MVKNILFQIFSLLYFTTFGQEISLEKVGIIPETASECSGITKLPSGNFAMINDSGNDPEVFITNEYGQLLKTIYLPDACNIDWEEVTYSDGHLYIGDFGNNNNERTDLAILKYDVSETDELTNQQIIKFNYADQTKFPPHKKQLNYDLEAMVHLGDSLYIFTKNRTKPFDGYTYMYGFPDKAGDYTISRIDSFKTGLGEKDLWWIAGAALSPNNKRLALLGYDKMWVFYDFEGANFFGGKHDVFQFPSLSQKESIAFMNNADLIITDELNYYGGGKVYHTSISEPKDFEVTIGSKEFSDTITINFSRAAFSTVRYEIFDTKGNRVSAGKFSKDTLSHELDTKDFKPGGYVIHILLGNTPYQAFKVKKLYSKTSM